jgi:lysophospholipase L1-like esterase
MRFHRLRRVSVGVLALIAALALLAAPAQATKPPRVMAALGDSITPAFNTEISATCPPRIIPGTEPPTAFPSDCPKNSWSTGTEPAVNSVFQRIEAIDPGRHPVAFNDAVSGSRAEHLLAQAQKAATQDPDYVTVLIGANDACRPTIAQQTPTADFREDVEDALETLVAGDPKVFIQVVSIPDINQLHALFTNPVDSNALVRWQLLNVCQALLANPTSTAQADVDRRAQFRAQVIAYNGALADVCAQFVRCRFDGGASFNGAFTRDDVATVTNTAGLDFFPWNVIPIFPVPGAIPNSTADYFHPSLHGQETIAGVAWGATFSFD